MRRVLVLAVAVFAATFGAEPFTPTVIGLDSLTQATLKAALDIQGMDADELGFFKQWAADSFFRLKVVDRLLDHPLDVVAYTESAAVRACELETLPAGALVYEWSRLDIGWTAADSARLWREIAAAVKPLAGTEKLPNAVGSAINTLLAGFRVGKRYLDKSVARLSAVELDRLLGEAPDFWKDEDTTEKSMAGILHTEFGKTYDTSYELKAETVLAYARKLDRKSLGLSGLAVVFAAAEARRLLASGPATFPHEAEPKAAQGVDGGVWFSAETEFGPVIIGSDRDNVYRDEAAVIIDMGGDDRYMNRAGGAVGVLGQPFSVVIDLSGDDVYRSSKLFSQGAVLFGTGVLIDCKGNDFYRSTHYCQGASMFGTGMLWDESGADVYTAGFFAQGSSDFGAALLLDKEGNDNYSCFCYGQGFASTWAYGLLADHAGNDVYRAGGRYLHEPLLPHEYRSFSHGFALGRRPDAAGGIGFLCDRSGNDFYDGEVFCEGTSYWYSLGMLWDGSGFDHYTAAQYSQGAGIHLSVGVLVDEEGNDSYVSRLGPSQGEGHDLSVGALVDRKGDDFYYCAGGQGIGLTNSAAFFLDADGNDRYMCADSFLSHGSSNFARGFGGMGVFMDLAGTDRYPIGGMAQNQSGWVKGTYGSGLDLPRPASVEDFEPDVDTSDAGLDSALTMPVESLFKTASMWEVGNVVKKVKRARKQLNKLGTKALDYVFEKKADTKDGLESRAVEELVKAWPDSAKPYLFRALRDKRFMARQNAAYWFGQMGKKARDAVDSIVAALKAERISPRRAANALGDIGDSLVVPKILYLLHDSYEPSRIVTAEACGKLKNPAAIPDLMRNLADPLFTVRSATEAALVATGTVSVVPLLDGLAKMESPALGHALRTCGQLYDKLDSTDQRDLRVRCRLAFVAHLRHKDAFVRLTAVDALEKLLDEPLVRILKEAQAEETNDFVLNRYRQVLAGKDD